MGFESGIKGADVVALLKNGVPIVSSVDELDPDAPAGSVASVAADAVRKTCTLSDTPDGTRIMGVSYVQPSNDIKFVDGETVIKTDGGGEFRLTSSATDKQVFGMLLTDDGFQIEGPFCYIDYEGDVQGNVWDWNDFIPNYNYIYSSADQPAQTDEYKAFIDSIFRVLIDVSMTELYIKKESWVKLHEEEFAEMQEYVDSAIAKAITTTLNTEV